MFDKKLLVSFYLKALASYQLWAMFVSELLYLFLNDETITGDRLVVILLSVDMQHKKSRLCQQSTRPHESINLRSSSTLLEHCKKHLVLHLERYEGGRGNVFCRSPGGGYNTLQLQKNIIFEEKQILRALLRKKLASEQGCARLMSRESNLTRL